MYSPKAETPTWAGASANGHSGRHRSRKGNYMKQTKRFEVERFRRNRWYQVIEDYDDKPAEFFRLKAVCYKLRVGDKLKFEGKSLGYAMFRTTDGRQVVLETKIAFRVVGRREQGK